jgi:hypothetical protein
MGIGVPPRGALPRLRGRQRSAPRSGPAASGQRSGNKTSRENAPFLFAFDFVGHIKTLRGDPSRPRPADAGRQRSTGVAASRPLTHHRTSPYPRNSAFIRGSSVFCFAFIRSLSRHRPCGGGSIRGPALREIFLALVTRGAKAS